MRAAEELWRLTRRPEDVEAAVLAALADPDRWVRRAGLGLAAQMGSAAVGLLPAVERLSQDPDRDVRMIAERVAELLQGRIPVR